MSTSPSITEARVTVKSLDDFAYEARLTEGEIRILILEPGVFDEVLRCTLLVTSLDNAPYFEAISYVWENQERSSELLCHDKSMHVTPSLALILRRMRLETQSRAIWADSICINQRDLIEKGKQVAFMAEIYSKADRTLIFVGNFGLECTEDLQVLLNEVEEDFMKDVLPGWNSLPRVASDHPLRSDKRWECIKYLSKNKWFSRGWCVQEAAVARDGQIIWGNAMLSWSQLMRVAWFAKNRLFAVFTEHISLPFLHMSAYLRTHEDEVKPFVDEESGSQFGKTLEYLQAARGLGLSQPHDRIYAFTNLPTSDEISNLNINPDYTKSFEDVCQDLAVRIIGTHQNLDVSIVQAQHFPSFQCVPPKLHRCLAAPIDDYAGLPFLLLSLPSVQPGTS